MVFIPVENNKALIILPTVWVGLLRIITDNKNKDESVLIINKTMVDKPMIFLYTEIVCANKEGIIEK
jgi:hypothetical protein